MGRQKKREKKKKTRPSSRACRFIEVCAVYQGPLTLREERAHRSRGQHRDKGSDEELAPEIKINVSISSKSALRLNKLRHVNHGGFDGPGAEGFRKTAQ